jgi:hypothetical protein
LWLSGFNRVSGVVAAVQLSVLGAITSAQQRLKLYYNRVSMQAAAVVIHNKFELELHLSWVPVATCHHSSRRA